MEKSRQVRRAEERALLKKLITKKDRRALSRINDTKLRKAIISEILNDRTGRTVQL